MSTSTLDRSAAILDEAISEHSLAGLATIAGGVNEWPDLDPLEPAGADLPQLFPFDGLGPILGNAARSIAETVQAPDAIAGGSVLATAALAAQPLADVELPHGQVCPLSLFLLTSAESGDRKSATDTVAGLPVDEVRREQTRRHSQEMQAYLADQAASGTKKDIEANRPVARSLTIGKPTVEGMSMLLKHQPHLGLYTSEGGELLGGHSMREDRRTAGLAWLLKAWGGETLDSLTRGDGLSILLGRRVSLHAMVQPVLLKQLLADPLAHGQGFLARCLIAEPQSKAGSRMFHQKRPMDCQHVQAYYRSLRDLLSTTATTRPDGDGYELTPSLLVMDQQAREAWIDFYNQVEVEQGEGGELAGARAFASKIAEQAARIGGVIQLVERPASQSLGVDALIGGIQVASYYLNEHLRLTGASRADRRLKLLLSLVDWMKLQREPMTWEYVLQRAPNQVRAERAAGIRDLMDELVSRGYCRYGADRRIHMRKGV